MPLPMRIGKTNACLGLSCCPQIGPLAGPLPSPTFQPTIFANLERPAIADPSNKVDFTLATSGCLAKKQNDGLLKYGYQLTNQWLTIKQISFIKMCRPSEKHR